MLINTIRNILNYYDEIHNNGILENFIDNEVKEVFKKSIFNGSLSGWKHHIILSDNYIYITGALSCGNITEKCYKGEDLILYLLNAMYDQDIDFMSHDFIKSLDNDIEKEIIEEYKITENLFFEDVNVELEEIPILFLEEYMLNHHEDLYNEYKNTEIDLAWDQEKEQIINKIYEEIEILREELKYD